MEEENNLYEGLKVFVAVPSFDKKIFANCHQSLMNALQVLLACKIPFQFSYEVGLPYVSMARNNLARKFMASDCTAMVFIDADVGFAPGAFHDLIISKEDVIGGAYPKKQDSEEYAVRLKKDENGNAIFHEGVLLAEGLATGFMKISRAALETMQSAYPELVYTDGMTGQPTYNFFGEYIVNGRMFYDDFGFCHLWAKTGGTMWVLPNITFSHAGSRNYEGNLHDYLSRPRAEAIINALKIDGFMTEEELTWLYQTAQRMNSIVEIGSWKGRSTSVLLAGCKGSVTAVDNWTGHDPASNGSLEVTAATEDVFNTFLDNVGHFPNLHVMQMSSADAADEYGTQTADMVFIDAEHTYEGCKADIAKWAPKARKLIALHDYSAAWQGVMQAVNEAFGPAVKVVGTIAYIEVNNEKSVGSAEVKEAKEVKTAEGKTTDRRKKRG